MVTIAPTLHDVIFIMRDDFLAWLSSMLGGLAWGIFVSVMILFVAEEDGNKGHLINRIGVAAGLGMSLAVGAIRLREATTFGDVIFAVGLTILEMCIVLGLEGIATQYRPAYQKWVKRRAAQTQAEQNLNAARAQRQRWKDKEIALANEIRQHIEYVEEQDAQHASHERLCPQHTVKITGGRREDLHV
jgi:hypothetical protein